MDYQDYEDYEDYEEMLDTQDTTSSDDIYYDAGQAHLLGSSNIENQGLLLEQRKVFSWSNIFNV